MSIGPVDRRRFLALSAGAAAVALMAACSRGSSQPRVDVGALHDLYPDTDDIERIGKYAVKVPSVGNRRAAIAAQLSPTGSANGLGRASAPALRSHLKQSVAADFAKNRVVDVAGWQLPLTEARIAALVHLTR
jgi:hypothetical protein